jgi:hypothetical protein
MQNEGADQQRLSKPLSRWPYTSEEFKEFTEDSTTRDQKTTGTIRFIEEE